jgi:macrodomain Ter protein organizer (MatP/YcbG family)|tara:strand:+ start:846 stop:1013 length:168 start_codon:yes stop_codon:yes gene_type:complete
MDPSKWKSVAVPISVWTKLKELADRNDRSVGGTISFLTKREYEKTVDTKQAQRVS